jgi:hypothetical protein
MPDLRRERQPSQWAKANREISSWLFLTSFSPSTVADKSDKQAKRDEATAKARAKEEKKKKKEAQLKARQEQDDQENTGKHNPRFSSRNMITST